VAEVMQALVPEVLAAVQAGLTGPEALEVPGLRALAARPGTARAVNIARAIRDLPAEVVAPAPRLVVARAPLLDKPFDELWPPGAVTAVAIVDGCKVSVGSCDPAAPTKDMYVDLVLADEGSTTVRVHLDWLHPVAGEGQCVGAVVRGGPRPGVRT
jgi:hypothetical protein